MEVTDRPPTRFSVVLPSEIRDQIRARARSLGTPESTVVKLVLHRYLVESRAESLELSGYEPPTHRTRD